MFKAAKIQANQRLTITTLVKHHLALKQMNVSNATLQNQKYKKPKVIYQTKTSRMQRRKSKTKSAKTKKYASSSAP